MTHATTRTHDTSRERDDDPGDGDALLAPAPSTTAQGEGARLARAALSLAAGLAVLILVFANLDRVAGWAAEHGTMWVYLGLFLVMSIAGRLFWWGTDTLTAHAVTAEADR
ncbi:hypothetical protein [Rhodococcus sp. OK302]|uniref:hypothetical protein n=1 Tax=Rhodococcus sp. OK302 TaxID=1882769 RepID=UPI000B93DAA4|nr:hypothetical protein [Rhodococcus sp. OK302]OYD61217.1 hypothetical protein BDB13_6174 [Rhodococcus sp. OK302]